MKNSFVMYTDYLEDIEDLEEEERGVLFTAILSHAAGVELPEMSRVVNAVFKPIRRQMDRDKEKYEETVNKRREAGRLGGRPRSNGSDDKAKKANGFSEKQTKAKKPDNDTVTDNDNVNDTDKDNNVEQSTTKYPYKEVVAYLNEKSGLGFKDTSKDTRKHIKARIDEGYTLDNFKTVIDKKVFEWNVPPEELDEKEKDMRKYIRPSTLFNSEKFDGYLNQPAVDRRKKKSVSKNKFNNFPQRKYDFNDLEGQLLGK